MKNISTGTGMCVLGLCLASYPIIDRLMPRAEAGATHVATVVAAATAQVPPEPTIVWYGATVNNYAGGDTLFRAWSDGHIEAMTGGWVQATVQQGNTSSGYDKWRTYLGSAAGGVGQWQLVSSASQGDAPRHDVPRQPAR